MPRQTVRAATPYSWTEASSAPSHIKTETPEHLLIWSPYSLTDKFERESSIERSASLVKGYYGLNPAVQTKRMENTLLPISSLSVELLSHVFVLTEYKLPDELSTLTRVCHYWRIVAIDTAKLWTCIPCDNPVLMEQYLKRSKVLPLDVHLFHSAEEDHPLDIDSPVYVLHHLHRIERLVVELAAGPSSRPWGRPVGPNTFAALCRRSAPKLRYLELSSNFSVSWGSASCTARVFPDARLLHLKLSQIGIYPNSHLLSDTLTSLHIEELLEPRFTWRELRDVLKPMSGLTRLHLEAALPLTDAPDLPLKPANLSSLEQLTVRQVDTTPLAIFFKHITFPGSLKVARVRSSVNDFDDHYDPMVEMMEGFKDACTEWETFWSSDIQDLSIERDVFNDERHHCVRGCTEAGVEKLSLELPYGFHHGFTAITAMLFTSGDHSIKSVLWDSCTTREMMNSAFRHCPDLQTIIVYGGLLFRFASCLAEAESQGFAQKVDNIFVEDTFTADKDYDEDEDEEAGQAQQQEGLQKLVDTLTLKHRSGHKIQRIMFRGRPIPSDTHERLKIIVGEVQIIGED